MAQPTNGGPSGPSGAVAAAGAATPSILAFVARDRSRAALRAAFPRRRARLHPVRSAGELATALRGTLTDAVIVDVGAPTAETERALALAREFPSVPFVGLAPVRGADGPALAACSASDFDDVFVDGVDDGAMRELLAPLYFTARFAAALHDPPPSLALGAPIQCAAWRRIVEHGGRPVRTAELAAALRGTLTDAVIVDVGAPTAETERALALAREFPSVPFVGLAPVRGADGPALAACAAADFADVFVDGVDDGAMRELLAPLYFTARFAAALHDPPPSLALGAPIQCAAWRRIVEHGGRPVRTTELAAALGVTREHLSRSFAAADAPNLKRVIDLVRLLAAAELCKNPGYDVRDVARVLGFASASHLSSTAQRVVGTRPASLSRLRAVDLVERFGQGRGRSRRLS